MKEVINIIFAETHRNLGIPDYFFENYFNKKQIRYAPKARYAIVNILKDVPNLKCVALPSYMCGIVPKIIKSNLKNCKILYYKNNLSDLNPSLYSFKKLVKSVDIDAVIVPSLYGQAADLMGFEKFCKEENIFMIDDAAQSFGSKLLNRNVGAYGNSGLISFGPSKPLPAHMGSFYWSDLDNNTQTIQDINFIDNNLRKLSFVLFYFQRVKSVNNHLRKILSYLSAIIDLYPFHANGYRGWESLFYGEIIRNKLVESGKIKIELIKQIESLPKFKNIIVHTDLKKINNLQKFVFSCDNQTKNTILSLLSEHKIPYLSGYNLLNFAKDDPLIKRNIFEIPIYSNKIYSNKFIDFIEETNEI